MEKIKQAASQLLDWIRMNKTGILVFSFLAIIFWSIPHVTFADDSELLSGTMDMIYTNIMGMLAKVLAELLSLFGKLIVLLLGMIIIPILGYNNFGNSGIIDIGWPLVRDVVNMFVIVVLLVIAIQTIVGYSKAEWQTQLPRFFIAVVLVNFSRTISLIMIDVSQVIMFTFVNALRDIAAGNFINLFQLNSFVVMGSDNVGESAIKLGAMFGQFFITLSLLIAVMGVLLILAIVYLYRIVLLWVLVILSPIAFFLGGVGQLFSDAAGKYQEWWKMMTGALTLGPILTFFLWLALASASSGAIAVSEGLDFAGTEDVPTLYAEIFSVDKLLSLMIAFILIMAGFKVASGAAQAMGSVASKLVTEDTGKKVVKNALKMPASAAYRTGRWGAKQTGRQIMGRTQLGQRFSKGLMDTGKTLSQRGGFIGRTVGASMMGAAGSVQRATAAPNIAGREKAREQVSGMTMDERVARANAMQFDGNGKPKAVPLSEQRRQEALMLEASTNAGFRKKLKKEMSATDYKQFMKASMQHVDKNSSELLADDSAKKNFNKTRAGHLNEWMEAKNEEKFASDGRDMNDAEKASELDDIFSHADFNVNQLSKADMANGDVQEALKKRVSRSYVDENGRRVTESVWDQVEKGQGVSNEVKDAALGVGAKFDTATGSSGASIAQALKHGNLDISSLTAADIADPTRKREIAEALARSGSDLSKMDAAVRADMEIELGSVKADAHANATDPTKTAEERARWAQREAEAHRAEFSNMEASAGATPAAVAARDAAAAHLGVNNASGAVAADQRENIRQVVNTQATQIYKFETAVNAGGTGTANDISKEIVRSLDQKIIRNMQNEFKKARDAGDVATQERIRKSIEVANNAFIKEAGGPAGIGNLDTQTKNLAKQMQNLERYSR